jgi:hypothetical protein
MVKLTELQRKVITRLANGSDGAVLVSILEAMRADLRDMGNLKEITKEEVTAHLLASDIIDIELISRLKIKSTDDITSNDEFE